MTAAMKSTNNISQWDIFFIVNMKKLKEQADAKLAQLSNLSPK